MISFGGFSGHCDVTLLPKYNFLLSFTTFFKVNLVKILTFLKINLIMLL